MRTLTTLLILVAYWGVPVFALVINRLKPTIANALGVPYGFLIGFVLGLAVMAIIAITSNWFAKLKPYYIPLFASALLTFFLFLIADQGTFSRFP